MPDKLQVDIVGSDAVKWRGKADSVVAPTQEGEIGLLSGHEPILSLLRAGTVRVNPSSGESASFAISGGFISFDHDVVTVVVDPVVDSE